MITSAAATATGDFGRVSSRGAEKVLEGSGAEPVHRAASGHFDGFQIQATALGRIGQNNVEQSIYFFGDLLLDCAGRFFSWPEGSSSDAGRRRQICSLI